MAATNRSANAVRSAAPRFLRTPEGGGFRAEVFMNALNRQLVSVLFHKQPGAPAS